MKIVSHSSSRVFPRASVAPFQPGAPSKRIERPVRPERPDTFESARPTRKTASLASSGNGDVQSLFREQFGALATDKTRFHETLRDIFGEGYDAKNAENYRQKALSGDFDWLPPVQWVGSDVLGAAQGAYDSESGTVLLNQSLRDNPSLAASTYVEEAGHHLDTKLNTVDAQGDEGELFRRILSGEKLTPAQIDEIRAENDKGTIQLNGRSVEVEFWNPFKAVVNAVKSVGKAVAGAVKSVAHAVVNTAKEIGNAVFSVAKGVVGAAKSFFTGVGEGLGGFFSNAIKGRFADAFQSLVRGADKAFFQAPLRLVNGLLEGADSLVHGASNLLGPLGKPLRALGTRAIDATRTLIDTVSGVARDGFRTLTEAPIALVRGVEESVKLAIQGKWGESVSRFLKGVGDASGRLVGGVVDVSIRSFQGMANSLLTLGFAEKPSRGLTSPELQMLKKVYGDSIDYAQLRIKQGGLTDWWGAAPHVVGNTVYLRSEWSGKPTFEADGSLTEAGRYTLIHEAGHVWQNQNGGGDFVHRALFAQFEASRKSKSGTRDDAYAWRTGVAEGKSFAELNPEQQAELMEEIGMKLDVSGNVSADAWDTPLKPHELLFALSAWRMVRRGEGSR